MNITTNDIRQLNAAEIDAALIELGEKPFRAKQLNEWLWKKGKYDFAEMTSLPEALRNKLADHFEFFPAIPATEQKSKDKTIKVAFELYDGLMVEGVLIPSLDRTTACISTQVGCPMGCKFCATANLGFKRNLKTGEIFDQVFYLYQLSEKLFNRPLSNIVIMGMGEPLLNYDNTLKAIARITDEKGLAMSPSRITLSTVGIPKMIRQLADDKVRFNLAISLHSANDEKRSQIIPHNDRHALAEIAESLKYFQDKTNSRITFEYLILGKFNDSLDDAKDLAAYCKNVACKVNIIEYNEVEGLLYRRSPETSVQAFATFLESKNIIVNLRKSKGKDIDAACGQLANKISKRK